MAEDWDGKGRRIHDTLCDKKWQTDRKEWVSNQICLATKGTKAKQVMMWTVMTIMLSAALTSAYKSVSNAQSANTTHVRNTNDISHLKEEVDEVKKEHDHLVGTVEEMQKTQGRMDRNIAKLLGAMGIKAETE